jgi:hypothetical protein
VKATVTYMTAPPPVIFYEPLPDYELLGERYKKWEVKEL